ncbi:hypothetical protein [Chamaesiphon sp. OTE_20_metabat_361]|uniref:hypothetical protein n=1 Tax=Chamaesiphon sp. OTE_20_metabat_361 TaxID=2964689 RepID=UPI00286C8988|nr:hypothetical protein [Chamaesiphon sp. OTE_20_metabat_361]
MSLLTHSLILADVAPGAGYTRNFSTCFKISNLNKYPNYLFFARTGSEISLTPTGAYVQMQPDRCLPLAGYRVVANITAIEKNKVKPSDLKTTSSGRTLQNSKLQKTLIKSTQSIQQPHSVPIINEGKQIETIYKIQSLDRQGLKLAPVSSSAPPMLNFLIFPAIGIAILGWVLWQRNRKIIEQ